LYCKQSLNRIDNILDLLHGAEPEGNRQLGRRSRRGENNIKIILKSDMVRGHTDDASASSENAGSVRSDTRRNHVCV
jgi:hypothetical protein